MGTGTTSLAASRWGRNSIGFEIDSHYFKMAHDRITREGADLFGKMTVEGNRERGPRRMTGPGEGESAKAVRHFWKTRQAQEKSRVQRAADEIKGAGAPSRAEHSSMGLFGS